ncbi:MAG TPA: hypothetical protein VGO11_18130 [Chthoniobacteraceae bacterium]|jgi:hypothetical protein|nr:hypothetical protein [Chthoniobacteraceae bacterium]
MSTHPDRLLAFATLAALSLCPLGARAQAPAATPYPRPGVPAFTPLPQIRPPATPYVRPATPAATPFARPLTPTPAPFLPSSALTRATPAPPPSSPPAREIPLVEKKLEDLSNQKMSKDGQLALSINPAKWKHAETDNFIIHYRRATEAQKVVREIEYDLWFVATTLKAGKDRYEKKSHVYVFEDEKEWKEFLDQSNNPIKWAASFAFGDELFLNIRGAGNSGTGSFDSHTLAHETTHAVVARLFRGKRWPLWLNEGFAEFMGGASVAARKGQSPKRFERDLKAADLPLSKLAETTSYPTSEAAVHQLYQSSEKFVRFLMTEMPKDRIVTYIEAVLDGKSLSDAALSTYNDKVKDWDDFQKKYAKFSK